LREQCWGENWDISEAWKEVETQEHKATANENGGKDDEN
jgi:hypothetical protein